MSSELVPPNEPAITPPPMMSSAPAMSAADENQLGARVAALESRFSTSSWLYGPNFLKRAFALWGHVFVAGLIIGIVVWGIAFVCALVFGFSLAGLANR